MISNNGIYYELYGTGKPIVFIHGMDLDCRSMRAVYEPLPELVNYRRIYIDLPGMGKSKVSSEIKSDEILNSISTFIAEITDSQPIVLVGHSYGGYLAAGLAHQLGSQITSLFLTCPVIEADRRNRTVEQHQTYGDKQISVATNQYTWFDDYYETNVKISDDTWNLYKKAIIPGLLSGSRFFKETLATGENYPFSFDDELKASYHPMNAEILLGEYDNIVGYKDQQKLFSRMFDANIEVIAESGHNLPIDQRHVVRERLINFLRTKDGEQSE
ncbi:alpha/beta hydrolase [Lentilactobacillus sp. Marseille-Q4993]|uniref:alpha/beta fold hydrolase n=1 Tax=Lentilactobacillus sp. Marseille-Q4993 TaxID=3039492 RepID=UPI0024BCE08C|nr:alpha/beta hydrolase [Lentilactobacillus sp. Marseille-Q4993]